MNNEELRILGGAPAVVSGANPAAGVECSITVPAQKSWKLLGVYIPLVQGATQTPLPSLRITDASGNIFASFPGASAATSASTTTSFTWGPLLALTAGAGATFNSAPIPSGLVLPTGFKITTVTSGIGANTDYGVPVAWVLELP